MAHQATQPVLVVPASSGEIGEPVADFNKVLVALDFNPGANAVIETALSLANAGSRVTLLHVTPTVPADAAPRYMYHLMEPEYQRHLVRDAWRRVSQIVPVEARTSLNLHTRVVTGDVPTEISRVAGEVEADLILMGVTRSGVIANAYALFGNTV